MTEVTKGRIEGGQELAFVNEIIDAPSVFIDGIKGVVVQPTTCKISFYEQSLHLQTGGAMGRFVMTLVMPNDQIRALAELLTKVADDNGPGNIPGASQ